MCMVGIIHPAKTRVTLPCAKKQGSLTHPRNTGRIGSQAAAPAAACGNISMFVNVVDWDVKFFRTKHKGESRWILLESSSCS